MNEEEQFLIEQENQNRLAMQTQLEKEQQTIAQQGLILDEQSKGLIKEQLELDEELKKLENLLRDRTQIIDEYGKERWVEPKDNSNLILNDAGINLVMKTIRFYINKNTLLSNYEEKIIYEKMEDFSMALANLLFMNYQKYFYTPNEEECYSILRERLDKKRKARIYEAEIRGEEPDEEKIWEELLSEMEYGIKREIEKIKEQERKDRLKGYELLHRQIQDSVHSAYQRSWKGQERSTLRQHTSVIESITPNKYPPQQSGGGGGVFNFFKR